MTTRWRGVRTNGEVFGWPWTWRDRSNFANGAASPEWNERPTRWAESADEHSPQRVDGFEKWTAVIDLGVVFQLELEVGDDLSERFIDFPNPITR